MCYNCQCNNNTQIIRTDSFSLLEDRNDNDNDDILPSSSKESSMSACKMIHG